MTLSSLEQSVYFNVTRFNIICKIYNILMKNHKGKLTMIRVIYRYFSTFDYFEVITSISISDIELNCLLILCRNLTREFESCKHCIQS